MCKKKMTREMSSKLMEKKENWVSSKQSCRKFD
ncbi:hypothetical protein DN38_3472 [Vibrio cholerae]|nr:hypothetical protein DN38_3472 [Vibrio cholerae]